jgi:membrane protease YdiL (CAAX protease family)
MKNSSMIESKMSELLTHNKLAILLELVLVFVPTTALIMLNVRYGSEFISLGGNVILLGGPLLYIAMVYCLVIVWISSRIRGVGWQEFGLSKPKSWIRTALICIGVYIGFILAYVLIVSPILKFAFPHDVVNSSRFDLLRGNLPSLLINIIITAFITAGFFEEFLWRGYLINRLVDLQGKKTLLTLIVAIVISSIIFGIGHFNQGLMGMVKVGLIGALLGTAFLVIRRNLWPLVIVHIILDVVSFTQHYLDV